MARRVNKKNQIKQTHYALWKQKYKRALNSECYLECILIDYAMIEDRLLALLDYLQAAQRHDERNPNWTKYEDIRLVLKEICHHLLKANGSFPVLKNISTKLNVIKAICDNEKIYTADESLYGYWLIEDAVIVLRENNMLDLCKSVEEWKTNRNTYVHALFGNYEYEASGSNLQEFAEQGMDYALELDAIVKKLKPAEQRYNSLRAQRARKLNLKSNSNSK